MYDVIVIGAGQAGLAAGYYLSRANTKFAVLEGNERVGDNWRKRWDGLQLFTPQRYNGLPGLPPGGGDWALIHKSAAADYLERYAEHFSLPVKTHCTCVSAKKSSDVWEIATNQGTLRARRIIVASGAYKDAYVPPDLSAFFPAWVRQFHSSQVRSVTELVKESNDIVVIGAGASGQQLSGLCADAGAKVKLLGPKVGNLPRRLLGKDIYWWLYKTGVMQLRTDRLPGSAMVTDSKGVVTVGEPKDRSRVARHEAKLVGYEDGKLVLTAADGNTQQYLRWQPPHGAAAVIWCTGYRNKYPFLPQNLLDEQGRPKLDRGISQTDETVAFLGLEHLLRINSSLLGGVGRDAREVINTLLE